MKKPLLILTGPTAVGKTKASIALAKAVDGEIISADSMQVYQEMNIGTAKITPEEMQGIPHHLIDILKPTEDFHAQRFQQMAKQEMQHIYERGKIPILVGGTGFYIQTVLYDIDFTEGAVDHAYREHLTQLSTEQGAAYLHEMLQEIDPVSAKDIHANNVKRVIRALEFYHQSGSPISEHNHKERQKTSPYEFRYFVLTEERECLYQRIEERIDHMLSNGLLQEVEKLRALGCTKDMVSMQGLGYKEMLAYVNGEVTFEEAVYMLKRDTRHFAKRQLTWFKREKDVLWLHKKNYAYDDAKILNAMLQLLPEGICK